jgi:hypothetical protein
MLQASAGRRCTDKNEHSLRMEPLTFVLITGLFVIVLIAAVLFTNYNCSRAIQLAAWQIIAIYAVIFMIILAVAGNFTKEETTETIRF